MALFFDAEWFDARLAAGYLTRADLARALGLSDPELAEIWKDQRELSARDVATIAVLLGVAPEDVAKHAGVSTPVPRASDANALADIVKRLERVEQMLSELKSQLSDLRRNG